MSWSELERLVEAAEQDGRLRRALRHCRSRSELVLAARRLQYRITLADLHGVWLLESLAVDLRLHRRGAPPSARNDDASPIRPFQPPGGLMEPTNASVQRGPQG